jgi:hypothetical protein
MLFLRCAPKCICDDLKEADMPGGKIAEQHYPTVEFVLDAIAGWINKYRNMHGAYDELVHCSQEDVMQIAKDLGVSVSDLRGLAAKGLGQQRRCRRCCLRFLLIRKMSLKLILP